MRRSLRIFEGKDGSILLLILAAALALRLWGLAFGLPFRYHPDEPQHVAEAARMLSERRLAPEIFNNPPLYKYVLMALDGAYAAAELALGRVASPSALAARLALDPSPLYLLGRVVSALAGAATALLAYLIGDRAYGKTAGLIAGAYLGVAFLHVRESHYAVNDALMTALVAASLLGAVGILRRGERRDYALAGAAAGLAFATKYTAAVSLIPLTLAHFYAPGVSLRRQAIQPRRLVVAWALAGVCAALASPYFVLDPMRVLTDIRTSIYSYGVYGFEGWQIDAAGGYVYYLKSLWWGLGPGLMLASAAGLALVAVRRRGVDVVLVAVPILLYAYMGRQQMYFARFLLPALPALLVLAARATQEIAERAAAVSGRAAALTALAAALLAAPSLAASVRHDVLLTRPDTRTLAKGWIETHLPAGAKIAVDWPHHDPPLSTTSDPEAGSLRAFDVLVVGGHGLADHPLSFYRSNGVDYLVASSSIENIDVRDPQEAELRREFYTELAEELSLVHVIRPAEGNLPFVFDEIYGPAVGLWRRDRPGPTLWIYALSPDSP